MLLEILLFFFPQRRGGADSFAMDQTEETTLIFPLEHGTEFRVTRSANTRLNYHDGTGPSSVDKAAGLQ